MAFDPKTLRVAIEQKRRNIKAFEDAIKREREGIVEYSNIITMEAEKKEKNKDIVIDARKGGGIHG